MFGLIMINKEVKGIIMLGHQIQMFGLIMINKEVKRILSQPHKYRLSTEDLHKRRNLRLLRFQVSKENSQFNKN
jgi:hypothetical protein